MNEDKKDNSGGNLSASDGASKKLINPDILKKIIIGLIILVIIVLIFGFGILVGEKKARFSYRWAENYHRNFAGPQGGFFSDWRSFPRGDFISSHGVFGQIIKIEESAIIIKDGNNMERIVAVKDGTIIERLRETVKISDLRVDDFIVVIGEPNDSGQIEAKFIRFLPTPPPEASLRPISPSMF
jgi:preprotein translocase subunit YajC